MASVYRGTLLVNNAQFVREPFEEFVAAIYEHGLSAVELTLQTPHFYVDSTKHHSIERQKSLLANAGADVISVQPLPYRYSICADAGSIQHQKTIGYYQQCILMAKELGASYVCITASGANYDWEHQRLLQNAEETLAELAQFAEEQGVILLLGSVFGQESPTNASTPVLVTLDEIKDMIECVGSESLGAYLDTAVISVCGETIQQWFESLGDKIKLVRFVDGNYNGYRVWGEGCLPCEQYLKQLADTGYSGAFALTIPGERYVTSPKQALSKNIEAVRSCIGGACHGND